MTFLRFFKCSFIIYIFIFNKFGTSNPPDEDEIIECTDHQHLYILKEGNKALFVESYVPKAGRHINILAERRMIIWQSAHQNEYLSLLKVYSSYNTYRLAYVNSTTDFGLVTNFYTRDGHYWYRVDEEYFKQYLEWLQCLRIFDLKKSTVENWNFRQENMIYGLNAMVFVPYPRFSMVEVCDGDKTIWEKSNETDHCTSVIIHGQLNDPKMINLHLNIGGLYVQKFFGKNETEWNEMQKEEFYSTLNELDRVQESEERRDE